MTRARLPPALAKNAAKESALHVERVRKAARADVELIKRRKARIVEDFYDIGEALARLRKPGVAQALGHASFDALCRDELGIAPSSASRLVAIVQHASREDALRFGQERTSALIELSAAVGATLDDVATKKLRLPDGTRLDVANATTRDLHEAAKELRALKYGERGRGRHVTAAELHIAASLTKALRDAGVEQARARAVATAPGRAAKLRIEVPADALPALAKAIRAVARKNGRLPPPALVLAPPALVYTNDASASSIPRKERDSCLQRPGRNLEETGEPIGLGEIALVGEGRTPASDNRVVRRNLHSFLFL